MESGSAAPLTWVDDDGGLPVLSPPAPATRQPPPSPEPEAGPEAPAAPRVRGLARGITVNGRPYADVGGYVPNGFAQDPDFFLSGTFDWVSRTRSCDVSGNSSRLDCADAVVYLELTPLRGENLSLGLNYSIQSLTGRNDGTDAFEGQSLGFRAAWNITPTTAIAFGGEHIIQFDDTIDLGRNFYLVLSQAAPLNNNEDPWMVVATAGIGSDFFGFGDNGFGYTNCLSGNNVSSRNYPEGKDCWWGPIGSLSLNMGSQFSLGFESFGYGIGAGFSVRPFYSAPLVFSFFATDFLGNTPSYIRRQCTDDPCKTRYYGRATFSF